MDGTRGGCEHSGVEFLGGGGPALYYRCMACGKALIVQGGKHWILRASIASA